MHHQNRPGFKKTQDLELLKDQDYQKVIKIVEHLWHTGVIERSKGYCFSLADMMYTLLSHEGIKSHIVECQLTVIRLDPKPSYQFLGYDLKVERDNTVNTHVVVITDTKIPLLIDLSIGYMHPDQVPFIVERVRDGKDLLSTIKIDKTEWLYKRKAMPKFPEYHQQSIIERIELDRRVEKQLRWLKIALVSILIIVSANAIRGLYHLDIKLDEITNRINNE